jgi:methionyl-tRNA formyltransferase
MRIVFLGSPEEVIAPLNLLLESRSNGIELVAVVSQPAKPQGRGRSLEDPPVARFAKAHNIPTLQPAKASDPDFLRQFSELKPDIAVTAAYGQILTDEFLAIPARGTINIHPSLLPKYRGATPVQSAIAAGESKTGVTVLFTVRKLDAGNIILQEPFNIGPTERAGLLMTRLFRESAPMLIKSMELLKDPEFTGRAQDATKVTHCRKIEKTDGNIRWDQEAEEIFNRFRAFDPWPGSYTFLGDKRIAVTDMVFESDSMTSQNPGQFNFDKKHHCLTVGTGSGSLRITHVKPSGSGVINAAAFWNGLKDRSEPEFHSGTERKT